MSSPLGALLESALAGLERCVRADGVLWDPASDAPAPLDHYAQTGAALALNLHRPEGREWREVLDGWLRLDFEQTGHQPFNRLLLLCLAETMRATGDDRDRRAAVQDAIARCRLRRSYPSNNWCLLAQLCRLLAAESPARRKRASRRLVQMLDRWTTETGGFIDFPARPAPGRRSTPTAYHHKALLVASLAARHTQDRELARRARKLLAWVILAWDEGGYAGGVGRSSHALFGDACLLASLTLAGADGAAGSIEHRILARVVARLARQQRADGLLSLNPAGRDAQRPGWDPYMHLIVYNAWFAAIVSWSRRLAQRPGPPGQVSLVASASDAQDLIGDRDAGLLRFRSTEGVLALLSCSGQPPQALSYEDLEFRYAGGLPYHLAWRGSILCAPPARVARGELRGQPALAGWTAVFDIDGELYGLTDFAVQSVQAGDAGLRVHLQARPRQLLRVDRNGLDRLRAALDWRFLGGTLGQRTALRRRSSPAIRADLLLTVAADRPAVTAELSLRCDGSSAVTWLNPGGHAVLAGGMICRTTLSIHGGSAGHDAAPIDAAQLSSVPIDSALPGMTGHCLPALELETGLIEQRLAITWHPSGSETPSGS